MHEQAGVYNLMSTVAINQTLKEVIEVSRQINLIAVNAILVAKRAGQQSSGFRVVALELQFFSRKVEVVMLKLGSLINDLVQRGANIYKSRRLIASFSQTIDQSQQAAPALQQCLQRSQDDFAQQNSAMQQQWSELRREIQRSLSLCSSGAMLSHNAHIEAAYGGEMYAKMDFIAGQVDQVMNLTIKHLKDLHFKLSQRS